MASLNLSAQLFYKDNEVIIHNLMDQQVGRYFLAIPTAQYNNFLMFTTMVRLDNSRIGTSEFTNDALKRKEFLEKVIKVNELFKNLNTNLVFSRVNTLKVLPVNELTDVLDPNKPFDMNKYRQIATQIENLINENFRLMTSSNIKNESIQQTIFLVSQHEQDKEFIEYLKQNLGKENNYKDINLLRKDYETQKIKLDISEYKEIINNDKKIIIGLNTSNEMFSVEFPNQYTMLEVFKMELNTIDKTRFFGLNEKQIARLIFDKIIKDLPSQRMVNQEQNVQQVNQNPIENQMLNQKVDSINENYLVDNNNNIAINQEEVIGIESVNQSQTQTYEFDNEKNNPSEVPVIESRKKLVKKPPTRRVFDENHGFIKIGTLILFISSLILTIASLALLIAS